MGWYVRNSLEPLIEGAKASETIEYNNRLNKKEFKQIWMMEKNELWKNKNNVWTVCGRNARNNR